jgi:hypothetical protein
MNIMVKRMRLYKRLWFIIPLIFISGCLDVPDKLVAPEWDVELNIPVINRVYTLNEVIGDQDNLDIESDSIYLIHTREYTQVRNLLDFLRLEGAISQDNLVLLPVNDSRDIFIDFRTDVVEIEAAVFSDGNISLNLRNTSSLTVHYALTVPGIRLNDVALVLSAELAPGQNVMLEHDLAGYEYSEPPDQPPQFGNALWLQASSQASGTNTGGLIEFDIEISEFQFSSVTGRFSEQDLGRRTDTINADLGTDLQDFRNKIHLAEAALRLSAEYRSIFSNPFHMRVDSLTVSAVSAESEIFLTDSTGSRFINFVLDEGIINIDFNQSNSNIIEIINSVPDQFIISASARILGDSQAGTITNEDLSSISLDINTRSILAVGKSTIEDTMRVTLNEEDREDIRNALLTNFTLDVDNDIPVKGWIRVEFLDSLQNSLFTMRIENSDTLHVEAAVVNPQTGAVTAPSKTFRMIDLTREEILLMAETHYAVVSVSIETAAYREPDPPLIPIKASDWMKVNVYGRVKYHVDL